MKKNILWLAAWLFPFIGLMSSCSSNEDIIFDHEQPAFELKTDKILLEALIPNSTSEEDDIYIVGPFNGLDDQSVIGNEQFKLMKSDKIAKKRGIYLDPSTFSKGKILAEGYHFVSAKQRNEVTALGDTIIRTEAPNVGSRLNLYISKWAAFFDKAPEKPTHDGYAIYVQDETGWESTSLYAWGTDLPELFGGWPGAQPTGVQTIDGVKYKYWDTGKDNEGLVYNLIFNGNGKQLSDFNYTLDHDVYLKITADGVEELNAGPVHDGFVVYVDNQTTWDALTLYMWGDVNDLNGAWPGMQPTGTQKIKGVTYTYFDMGEANTGKNENLIFNNNGGKQLADFKFTINRDIYLKITDEGVEEVGGATPAPDPKPADSYKLYIDNQTGWTTVALYVWGDTELFGKWPGIVSTKHETIDGVEYIVWEIGNDGKTYHPIINNNDGGNQSNYSGEIKATRNYFFKVEAGDVWTEITPATAKKSIYLNR